MVKIPWFKVDDGFWSHPKVLDLDPSAIALWVRAGSYAAQHLTDGHIRRSALRMLGHEATDAEALVASGLWDATEIGYVFHDWSRYQPPSAASKAKRDEVSQKRAEAGRRGAAKRWQEGKQDDDNTDGNLPSVSDGNAIAPSRPVPSRTSPPNGGDSSSSEVAKATARPEVEQLLDLLDAGIVANGGKKPARNKRNRDAIRLMLDRDNIPAADIAGAIRWSQADEFWRANILSASKLRERYDQLRLTAQRSRGGQQRSRVDENFAEYERLYGGDHAGTGSVRAIDSRVGA